jgi:uncharacterized repeat protein (TIGR03803 family)
MHQRNTLASVLRFATIAFCLVLSNVAAFGSADKIVHNFAGPPDGAGPWAGLITDKAGNFYGTTGGGGLVTCLCGTVFELSPPTSEGGSWTETILYSFQGLQNGGHDGLQPNTQLVMDDAGNLFGGTQWGGKNNRGTIYELSPPAVQGGQWTESVLYSFVRDGSRGSNAFWLVVGLDRNLYGTTLGGGTGESCGGGTSNKCGVVFVLERPSTTGGAWDQHILHNFGEFEGDSATPLQIAVAPSGSLYGMAGDGGTAGKGTFFRLSKNHGSWTEEILFDFSGSATHGPTNLTFDPHGNVFAVTSGGGDPMCQCGGVVELLRPATPGGAWSESPVYNFMNGNDGSNPFGPLVFDKAGDLFGTAAHGGDATCQCGAIFELTPPAVSGDIWSETTLHDFVGPKIHGDGSNVNGGLVFLNGKLYGTTTFGGAKRGGTVFSMVP